LIRKKNLKEIQLIASSKFQRTIAVLAQIPEPLTRWLFYFSSYVSSPTILISLEWLAM